MTSADPSPPIVPAPRRVFLIDDHAVVRQGISLLVRTQAPTLEIVGEAGSANGVLEQIAGAQPDLVILDLSLPGKSGLEVLRDLRIRHPQLKVLVLSMHRDFTFAERALRAGANGYMVKTEAIDAVLTAVDKILAGQVYVSPDLASKFVQSYVNGRAGDDSGLATLSDREFEVFKLIADGLDTKEMAESLSLSIRTIETYRQNIKSKLKLRRAQDLYLFATRWVEADRGDASLSGPQTTEPSGGEPSRDRSTGSSAGSD